MRHFVGRLFAIFYRVRTLGRLRGSSFILRSPSTLRIGRGYHIAVGKDVMIDKDARIVAQGGNITIGDNVFIGKNATLIAFADLTIGPGALLGQNCSIHTENHGASGNRNDFESKPVVIADDVWLGAGVVVTSGRRIERGATVGANSVVTKDLAAGSTYAGVPAKLIRGSVV